MSIAVIAGLGNPGPEYDNTRHNIGFTVVDKLASSLHATWKNDGKYNAHIAKVVYNDKAIVIMKPQTYMNESGLSLGAYCRFNKIKADQVIVVYDDIGLDCGRSKISLFGGSGGHNGIESLFQHLGLGFIRYRIGVGAKLNPDMDLKNYVLGTFSRYEKQLMDCRIPEILSDIKVIIDNGVVHGMNHINKKEKKEKLEKITDESDNDKKQI
jgi:peptidyl-tRNA hydrolase, PTH1 family